MTNQDPYGETFGSGSYEDVLGETLDGAEGMMDRRLRSMVGPISPMMAPPYGFERVVMRGRRRRQRKILLGATAVVAGLALASGGVLLGFRATGPDLQTAGCGSGSAVLGKTVLGKTVLSEQMIDGANGPGGAGRAGAVNAVGAARVGWGRGTTMQRKYEWAIGGVLTAGALAGGIFAGCSTNSSNKNQVTGGASASAHPSQNGNQGASQAPSTPAAGGGTPSPSATGAPRCHTVDLSPSVSVVNGSQAAGSESLNLTLTNNSGHVCTIFGFPGMMLEDQNGNGQATVPTRDHGVKSATITLANGASASSTIRFDFDVPGPGEPSTGNCEPPSYSLLITPPDETTQLTAPIGNGPVTVCQKGALDVLPFIAGTTGANQ